MATLIHVLLNLSQTSQAIFLLPQPESLHQWSKMTSYLLFYYLLNCL